MKFSFIHVSIEQKGVYMEYVKFVIMLIVGLGCIIFGLMYFRSKKKTAGQYEEITGKIIDSIHVYDGYSFKVSYEFAGKTYESVERQKQKHSGKNQIGKEVVILVNQDYPEKFVMKSTSNNIAFAAISILPGVAIIVLDFFLLLSGEFK